MAGGWMDRVDGKVGDMDRHERRSFFAYAYRNTAASRTALTFGLPLLFVIGWARDYAVDPGDALDTLWRRLLLFGLLIGLALVMRARLHPAWREVALVAYACTFSAGIAMTTLAEPARLSLTHVAAVLTTIIVLPFALHRATAIAVILAFAAPLFAMLMILQSPAPLYWAYLSFAMVGIGIGLGHRRVWLDTAVEVFQLRRRLLARVHVDALTGVLNREGWEVRAARTATRAQRERRELSVVYFDLDHFKQTNDTHGHAVGDALLRSVAVILRNQCRSGELVARIGGEEFLALLPGANGDAAMRYAERIRATVAAMRGPVPCTVSCGVATAEPQEALDAVVARADAAMLEAKRRGRNRVLRSQWTRAAFSLEVPDGE